jgi:hypothetical protein
MDPKVVTNQAYAGTIKDDLMYLPALSIVLKPDDMFGGVNGIYTHSDASHTGPAWTRACSVELINPDGSGGFQLDASIKIHGGGSREQSKEKKHPLALGFKAEFGPSKLQYQFFPDSPVASFDKLILRSEYNNHWTHEQDNAQRARVTMVRDEWFKDTLARMGSFYAGVCDMGFLNETFSRTTDATESQSGTRIQTTCCKIMKCVVTAKTACFSAMRRRVWQVIGIASSGT